MKSRKLRREKMKSDMTQKSHSSKKTNPNTTEAESTLSTKEETIINTKKNTIKRSLIKKKTLIQRSRNTEYHDDPEDEIYNNYIEDRKQLLFNEISGFERDMFIRKFLLKSQINLNKKCTDIINLKKKYWGFSTKKMYDYIMEFKESICNYFLIFSLYLNENRIKEANIVFLLLVTQNSESLEFISNEIEVNFGKTKTTNRIAKYYPTIVKIFLQVLACLIKFSAKFNKHNYLMKFISYYMKTIIAVKSTIITKFTSANNDPENDMRILGKYLFLSCLNDLSFFLFKKFQPLPICIDLLQKIINDYKINGTIYTNEITNFDQILILKSYYNLGVLNYANGNVAESLLFLNESKKYLKNIKNFPIDEYEEFEIIEQQKNTKIIFWEEDEDTNILDTRSSIINKQYNRNSLIEDDLDKYLSDRKHKRTESVHVKRERKYTEDDYSSYKEEKEDVYVIKRKCNLSFGNKPIFIIEKTKNSMELVKEKINTEIEFLISEIELEQKRYDEAYTHIKNIVQNPPSSARRNTKSRKHRIKFNNDGSLDQNTISKRNLLNVKNAKNLNEEEMNKVMTFLKKIEEEKNNKNSSNGHNILTNRTKIINFKSSPMEKNNKKEAEKFFIFLCGLNIYQLKVLNDFQPKQSQIRDDLPILFPNQFKDCLTFTQRLALNNLETMSLSRFIILKDTNKDITPENIDYYFLLKNVKLNDYDQDNEYSLTKMINEYNNIQKEIPDGKSFADSNDSKLSEKSGNNKNKELNKKMSVLMENERFKEFMEENKKINAKLDEISKFENNDFIKNNKEKILRTLHKLNDKEKNLLLNSKTLLKRLLTQIEKEVNKKIKKNKDKSSRKESDIETIYG